MAAALALLGIGVLASPFISDAIHKALARPPKPGPISQYPMTFEHLGYGDLSSCGFGEYPIIKRTDQDQVTTILVRASVPCGLEVRNPAHYAQDGVLHLSYETHFTGSVDMCNCEYQSVFTLKGLPESIAAIDFTEHFFDSAP